MIYLIYNQLLRINEIDGVLLYKKYCLINTMVNQSYDPFAMITKIFLIKNNFYKTYKNKNQWYE